MTTNSRPDGAVRRNTAQGVRRCTIAPRCQPDVQAPKDKHKEDAKWVGGCTGVRAGEGVRVRVGVQGRGGACIAKATTAAGKGKQQRVCVCVCGGGGARQTHTNQPNKTAPGV
jgi:hypothetical protein